MNLDQYIGLPYREGARGPDAFDCYGLVAAVYKAVRGIELPDWYQPQPGAQAASRAIAAAVQGAVAGGRSEKVEQPEDWDIAVVGSTARPHHVGIYIQGGILHSSRSLGSAWHQLRSFQIVYPHVEFYRWQA